MARFRRDRLLPLAACLLFALNGARAQSLMPPIASGPALLALPRLVPLRVIVNGEPVEGRLNATFLPSENRLLARRADIEAAGIRAGSGSPDEQIALDSLGIAYSFDAAHLVLTVSLSAEQRAPKVYGAQHKRRTLEARSDSGFLVNYSLFSASIRDMDIGRFQFSGANVELDGIAFTPFGWLEQTGMLGTATDGLSARRGNSTFTIEDERTGTDIRIGDTTTGALPWTRPIRIGGAQAARDFTLRPDVVTQPLPQITGTATLPSTVDVFIDGTRTFSQAVSPGPYTISDLPLSSSGGQAEVVTRDINGREVRTSLSLFDTARLLSPEVTEFSLEAGVPRRNFGLAQDGYALRPVGVATVRSGVTNRVTLEGHAEGGSGLAQAGAGAIFGLDSIGTLSIAGAASRTREGWGAQAYLADHIPIGRASLDLAWQHTFGRFEDLGSVTARQLTGSTSAAQLAFLPTRSLLRVGVAFPLFDDQTRGSLGFVRQSRDGLATTNAVTGSLSRRIDAIRATASIFGFLDLSNSRSGGIFASLGFQLGPDVSASVGADGGAGRGLSANAEVRKIQPLQSGSYGYHARVQAGSDLGGEADGTYRTPYGQLGVQLQQTTRTTYASAVAEGSIAVTRSGVVAGYDRFELRRCGCWGPGHPGAEGSPFCRRDRGARNIARS